MAITTRQTSLLAAEDWTKIYQTYKDADFQSYDFETIRKSMIDYMRLYYPEDFNDYIDSSEFIALIDLLAFLGQGLAYRNDLNTRENFIDTAERRESILRLVKLISYTTKRTMPASGILKIQEITTTEQLYDSNGYELTNVRVGFNDGTNANWQEQFNIVMNAALSGSQKIGQPDNRAIIAGVQTDEYTINTQANELPIYAYNSNVNGNSMPFEVTSVTTKNREYWYEKSPYLGQLFNILYRNDNLGNSSPNTGFFMHFKQGNIRSVDFEINDAIPNRIVSINFPNINQTDVWLYQLNDQNGVEKEWTPVPAIHGQNIAYNNVAASDRDVYQIVTNADDSINLVFGDGVFASIPHGRFRLYFRLSNGLTYKISPDEMANVTVPINYISRTGRVETLTLTASLEYTVANASARELADDIRQRAPQQYYTQNRMVNGEDYNVFPYTSFNNIVKVKAVNRTSSGISRFLDVLDTAGNYSSTNIFCEDGLLYEESYNTSFKFEFTYSNDIISFIKNTIEPIITDQEMIHFYYANYERFPAPASGMNWNKVTASSNQSTGYFTDDHGNIIQVGTLVADTSRYVISGTLVEFSAPAGYYFDNANIIRPFTPDYVLKDGERTKIFSSIVNVVGDGTAHGAGISPSGLGPITLSEVIPTGAYVSIIIPYYSNDISTTTEQDMVDLILAYRDFGLRYDVESFSWKIIAAENLDRNGEFSLEYAGDDTAQNLDASWVVKFETDGTTYEITYRGLRYIFESVLETRFYYDEDLKVFDPHTGTIIHDYVNVLKVNSGPDTNEAIGHDSPLYIYGTVVEEDGYTNNTKIKVTYADHDNDGVPDNPDFFEEIVAPGVNPDNKYVFFEKSYDYGNFETLRPIDAATINTSYGTWLEIRNDLIMYDNGQEFFATDEKTFWKLEVNGTARDIVEITNYDYRIGRQSLYFQYRHNSPNNRRIDPSPANIIDLFILTSQYETDYKNWVSDITGTVEEPARPDSLELHAAFNLLDEYKMVSDTIIYNSAKFKPLFGKEADPKLQATFKVVKNASVNTSDSQVKSKLISALNRYFDINNWDFGETFYFTELSTYLHQELVPDVASIIIVPKSGESQFGALFQVNSEPNEIITNAATVEDVQIIPAITAAQLKIDIGDN